MGNISSSTRGLHDEYSELLQNGNSIGFVMTRDGFGLGVKREGTFTDDIIVEYVYPHTMFEAYGPAYVKRLDFMVSRVEEDDQGCYMVTCAIGKDQAIKRPLTDELFDQRPFKDETLRVTIQKCYETWKARQKINNPFDDEADCTESSAISLHDDPTSPFNTESRQPDSGSTSPIQEYVYEYEYE